MKITEDNNNCIRINVPDTFAIEEVEEARSKIHDYMEKGANNFIFDFENCGFIDSTGLGLLVSIHKRCVERQGKVKLCELSQPVEKILHLTRLDQVFAIYNTYGEALNG